MIEVTDCLLFFRGGDTCTEFHKAVIATYLDVAMMGIYDCPRNGKTQAIMLILAVPGGIHAVEAFKDPLPVFWGDLITGVDHRKLRHSVFIC